AVGIGDPHRRGVLVDSGHGHSKIPPPHPGRISVPLPNLCAFSLMFPDFGRSMLASMTESEWSDLVVGEVMGELPTGTVPLLLADVEGSTRLWQTQPDEITAALARLDSILADLLKVHGGVRPVEQGEGDSFVAAFPRASDAVECALDLQRTQLAPIR